VRLWRPGCRMGRLGAAVRATEKLLLVQHLGLLLELGRHPDAAVLVSAMPASRCLAI
jgi:hypothetical protein